LIRNLNNFGRNGVFNDERALNYAIQKITSREAIKNSKLFPFRFYIAHQMLRDYVSEPRLTGSQVVRSLGISRRLREALLKALEISVENVPEIVGKVAVLSDVSGSMSSSLTGDYSVVQCIDLVGLFTGILLKRIRTPIPILLPFNHEVRMDIATKVMKQETIMDVAKVFSEMYGGGTSLSAPIRWLIDNKETVDLIIGFTDNEEWVGDTFIETFMEYRSRINPEVRAYFVTLLPYRDYPVPPEVPNVHFVFGWNDNVLRYITTDPTKQMVEIENTKL